MESSDKLHDKLCCYDNLFDACSYLEHATTLTSFDTRNILNMLAESKVLIKTLLLI